MFRGFGFPGVVEPFALAGFVEFAASVVGVAVGAGAVVVPAPADAPEVGALVAAAGKVVIGVGSGGNGFVNTLAMNSGKPVS